MTVSRPGYLRPFLLGIASAAGSVVFALAVLAFVANVFIGQNLGDRAWVLVWTIIGLAALGFWTLAAFQWRRAYRATQGLTQRPRIVITLVLAGSVALVLFVAAVMAAIRPTCGDC